MFMAHQAIMDSYQNTTVACKSVQDGATSNWIERKLSHGRGGPQWPAVASNVRGSGPGDSCPARQSEEAKHGNETYVQVEWEASHSYSASRIMTHQAPDLFSNTKIN